MEQMSLPVIISKRPVWDTFPGAWYTIAIDVIMPNGRTLQVASCHHYKDQWAKAFDITYQDESGDSQYCHQTTYGMSERLLGAVVGMHGDDNGLIFPPPIASHKSPTVNTTVESVADTLRAAGYRIKIDSRDLRPGQKYWDWEIKGVPLRLEIGPRDVENGTAFAARRTGGKDPIPLDNIVTAVREQLDIVHSELNARSHAHVEGCVIRLESLDQEIVDGQIYEVAFDGTDADAEHLEKSTGLTILGDAMSGYDTDKPCIVSGKMTTRKQHIARMY